MRGISLKPLYSQKSLNAQAWSSDLDGAIGEGQTAFQILGPLSRKLKISKKGERPGEMMLDAGAQGICS